MEFEWDLNKEVENVKKHGVAFSDAVECFEDPSGFALSDRVHSGAEQRYFWIGKAANGKILTVRYTKRRGKIRIIGAAEWRKFRELYNERAKTKRS